MSFFCDPGDNSPLSPEAAECKDVSVETFSEVGHLSLTRDQLIVEQKNDATLSPLELGIKWNLGRLDIL